MKRCKRDCKNMNNQSIVSADRISELPETLILHILSLLPTNVAVATSVLSKTWQSRWKFLPTLNFDYYRREHETFSKNVCKALRSHKAPVLQSLHLNISSQICNAMDTGILIGTAFARNVRKLVLHSSDMFIFPKSLYNCETLETLELKCLTLMDIPSSVSLKALRTLDLLYVEFKDDGSILNLLSGCPKLENLVLHEISYNNVVKTITIAVPSLQRLSICIRSVEPCWVINTKPRPCWVISAPSLKYLKIRGIYGRQFCMTENLQEANIIDVSGDMINEKLMGSLSSVKRLSMSLPPFKNKFPTGIIFYQLVYLELYTYEEDWWKLLTLMLDGSPKLQVLKLGSLPWKRNYFLPLGKWNQPKNVPECLLFHLETFMWKHYNWERGNYKSEVAKYILSNSNRLTSATFSSTKKITRNRRVKMFQDLNSVVKASNSCQILFSEKFIY